jgi:glycosyltransferase involved in cell wall biosynthesis
LNVNFEPLVSVLTPVYNGEDYLAECLESVLAQNYANFEFIIVDNASEDRTRDIACEYAKRDSRIRVHRNPKLVPVIANHNIAFRSMSPSAKYCKIVCADDWIFPNCLSHLVDVAENNPSVGIVGCYQLSGSRVRWQGFDYPQAVFPGRDLCRRILLGNNPDFGFGAPTSLLYRADLVREHEEFFPNPSPHADTSACFRALEKCDFGFIYEILAFERMHTASQTHTSKKINRYASAYLSDLLNYGRFYLSETELDRCVRDTVRGYRKSLSVNYVLGLGSADYWAYHKGRLAELGFPIGPLQMISAAAKTALWEIVNPGQAIDKFRRRIASRH